MRELAALGQGVSSITPPPARFDPSVVRRLAALALLGAGLQALGTGVHAAEVSVPVPFSSADSNAVSLVNDWSGVSSTSPTTFTFASRPASFISANGVTVEPAAGNTYRRSTPRNSDALVNQPSRANGAGYLEDIGDPADPNHFRNLTLNFNGRIDFKFATPLDQNSGILTIDIDIPQEVIDFVFLDADGVCLDPTGWEVKDVGTNQLVASNASVRTGTKDGCTSIAIHGTGGADDPLAMIVPGAPVSTVRVYSVGGGIDNSVWRMAFVQSGNVQSVPPTANNDAVIAQPGATITVNPLGNDTPAAPAEGAVDPTQAALDPTSVQLEGSDAGSDGKTKTVPGEGVWTVNPDGSITFTPAAGFTGVPTPIEYTVADVAGDRSAPASITVTQPAAATPVPTLGEWAMLLLAGLLGALGLRRLHQRRG